MWDDAPCSLRSQDGKAIPVLPLHRCLQAPLEEILQQVAQPPTPSDPCTGARERLGAEFLGKVLDRLGEERFQDKVARFRAGLATEEAGQVLYEGIMEALGYSRNKESFRELAQRLPLRILEGLVQGKGAERGNLILEALLLGTAGLLPSQRRGPGATEDPRGGLERIWSSLGGGESMTETRWQFAGVRPGNHPIRRQAAASGLILRFLDRGLVEGILELVGEAQPPSGHRKLEAGLMIADKGEALLGQGRAAEVVVNIVLPFSFAFGELSGRGEVAERAMALYRSYPGLGENETTRFMAGQFFDGESPQGLNSARRQQGLIQLYRRYCQDRFCAECPVGEAVSRDTQPSLSPGFASRSQPATSPALI
jgi:hypothetical protein